jgi:hypothetical protein
VRHFAIIANKIVAVHISLALCRTFGAHYQCAPNPDLTVGPILCRAFGPASSSNHQILSFETVSEAATHMDCFLLCQLNRIVKVAPWSGRDFALIVALCRRKI